MSQVNFKLKVILADTFVLYMKSFHIHWNMKDERFYFLHKMLEEQYKELAEFIDTIAERVRQKGEVAPKSLKEIIELKSLAEVECLSPASEMLFELIRTYEQLLKEVHELINSTENDFVTQDLMIEYAKFLEKTIWILKSHQK